MNRRTRRVMAAVAAVGVALSSAGVAKALTLASGGATFPNTFLTAAFAEYNKTSGHTFSYAGGGSTAGKNGFAGGSYEFAGTDSAYSSGAPTSFQWTYVPYLAGAISVAYRLDELGGASLPLSENTLNGIFTGSITKWNDSAIADDVAAHPSWANTMKKSKLAGASAVWQSTSSSSAQVTVALRPKALTKNKGKAAVIVNDRTKKTVATTKVGKKGEFTLKLGTVLANDTYTLKVAGKDVAKFKKSTVTLPDKNIVVVYRSDGSGTTNNFCNYMKSVNSSWAKNDSFSTCVAGAGGVPSGAQGQSGSTNLANYIANNNGTIGYVELSFVTEESRAAKGIRSALVRNYAGRYVAPTSASYNSFLGGATVANDGLVTFNFKQASNYTAYPIGAVTYMLAKKANNETNVAVREMLQWVLNTYAPGFGESLGYVPLSGTMLTKAKALAATVGAS